MLMPGMQCPTKLEHQANFWTLPFPYWNMKELAPELYDHLRGSNLVIFKVNINICDPGSPADPLFAL